jgi:hypothetical protein
MISFCRPGIESGSPFNSQACMLIKIAETARIFLTRDHSAVIRRFAGAPRWGAHSGTAPGKISVVPIRGMTNQRDLALAYLPGVAVACKAIAANPDAARNLTSRDNLVAVVTNDSAVLVEWRSHSCCEARMFGGLMPQKRRY